MQISNLPIPLPQSPNQQRPDSTERLQRIQEKQAQVSQQQGDDNASRDLREERQRQVIASRSADQVNIRQLREGQATLQRQQNSQDLPLNTQRALQAFQQNSPSVEDQLGVELVGVDTFA